MESREDINASRLLAQVVHGGLNDPLFAQFLLGRERRRAEGLTDAGQPVGIQRKQRLPHSMSTNYRALATDVGALS